MTQTIVKFPKKYNGNKFAFECWCWAARDELTWIVNSEMNPKKSGEKKLTSKSLMMIFRRELKATWLLMCLHRHDRTLTESRTEVYFSFAAFSLQFFCVFSQEPKNLLFPMNWTATQHCELSAARQAMNKCFLNIGIHLLCTIKYYDVVLLVWCEREREREKKISNWISNEGQNSQHNLTNIWWINEIVEVV